MHGNALLTFTRLTMILAFAQSQKSFNLQPIAMDANTYWCHGAAIFKPLPDLI
jgi:hypothetical protein